MKKNRASIKAVVEKELERRLESDNDEVNTSVLTASSMRHSPLFLDLIRMIFCNTLSKRTL
jgi:hypothetical protein